MIISECLEKSNNFNEKINDIAEHKQFALSLQKQFARIIQGQKGERVLHCGDFLTMAHYKDPANTHELFSANFCKNKLCPFCSWRASLKVTPPLMYAAEQQANKELYHLVVTTPNIKFLTKEFLLSFRQNTTKFLRKYMNCNNYVLSLEITISKTGEFHPHFHILGEFENIPPRRKMQHVLAQYLNISTPWAMTHMEKANANTIQELTKYIVKFESKNTPDTQLKALYFATKGLRRFSIAGNFKDCYNIAKKHLLKVRKEEKQNLLSHGTPVLEFYKWLGKSYTLIERDDNGEYYKYLCDKDEIEKRSPAQMYKKYIKLCQSIDKKKEK